MAVRRRQGLLGAGGLVAGAPCANTLRSLCLAGEFIRSRHGRAFVRAFGQNALPCLQKLALEGDEEWLDEEWVGGFQRALVRLVERGTPSPLRKLVFVAQPDSLWHYLDALTPAFAAGGLACLTHLQAPMDWEHGSTPAEAFFDKWAALGPRIRLEAVHFHLFHNAARRRLLHAVANPAFLPFLSRLRECCDAFDVIAKAALDRRGLARLGVPAAAIAAKEEVDDSFRYFCMCDARTVQIGLCVGL